MGVTLGWRWGRREVGIGHERNIKSFRETKFSKVELCRNEGPFISKFKARPVYDLMLAEWLQGVAGGKGVEAPSEGVVGRGRGDGGGAVVEEFMDSGEHGAAGGSASPHPCGSGILGPGSSQASSSPVILLTESRVGPRFCGQQAKGQTLKNLDLDSCVSPVVVGGAMMR